MTTLEFVTVRDFKTNASRLIRQNETVLVFRNGKPAGVFIPWDDIKVEDEVRRAALKALTAKLDKERAEKGITEEEVLEDFANFRENRRRRQRNSVISDRREGC
ncbi:MAG: type II toxin-antitoxin system Phd/YefM family antitoxin [Bacillota bacterium]